MDALRLSAISPLLLIFVSAWSAEPSSSVVISDGDYIGFTAVAEALSSAKAQRLMPLTAGNGVSFVESDTKTTWTFADKDDPAYPAVAKVTYMKSDDSVLHVEITVLCEAADAACAEFRSDIRSETEKFFMILAADPTIKCRSDGITTKCAKVSTREHTNQQILLQIADDGSCSVDRLASPCLDVGNQIRGEHPSDDPTVVVCASPSTKYDALGRVLRALHEQDLPMAFGCTRN